MKHRYRMLGMLLTVLLALTLFGCANEHSNNTPSNDMGTEATDTTQQDTDQSNLGFFGQKDASSPELIGQTELNIMQGTEGGLIYESEDGLKGIIFDDKTVTDAKYTSCQYVGGEIADYFQVSTTEDTSIPNRYGIVKDGKEVVPTNYAYIDRLSDRYYYVCEVTGETSNREEALLFATDSLFVAYGVDPVKDGDTLLTGKWYIYDAVAGAFVEGATGTKPNGKQAYGDILLYYTDEKEKMIINHKGEKIPDNATIFANGCYNLSDQAGALYDANNNILFDLTGEGVRLTSSVDTYIAASKRDSSNNVKYFLLDLTGKTVSSEFDSDLRVYGELLESGKKIYDFEGNLVFDGAYDNIIFDKQWKNAWRLENYDADSITIINKNGDIIYQGDGDASGFTIYKGNADGADNKLFYSLADKDFTIAGFDSVASWIVRSATDTPHTYDLFDTVSGKKIFSGISRFVSIEKPGEAIFIYVGNKDNGWDIYRIQ